MYKIRQARLKGYNYESLPRRSIWEPPTFMGIHKYDPKPVTILREDVPRRAITWAVKDNSIRLVKTGGNSQEHPAAESPEQFRRTTFHPSNISVVTSMQ